SLDPGTAQAVRQIVLRALDDPEEGVRAFTVHALGKFGSEEMIAALRKVAETDPSQKFRVIRFESQPPKPSSQSRGEQPSTKRRTGLPRRLKNSFATETESP